MPTKYIYIGGIIALLTGGILAKTVIFKSHDKVTPTPRPSPQVEQLSPDQAPSVSLNFSPDGHYVTVNITKIHAAMLEYNLIYDAKVKNNLINTGVSGSSVLDNGKDSYTYKQLLGSESSGHFTYHEQIHNATMELTLRNSDNYSVYNAVYPFTVSPGSDISLTPSQ
jgi:hypothetical protein